MDKQFVVNLLFDDGVITVTVDPPEILAENDFEAWCLGVDNGISAYLTHTQEDRNFKRVKPLRKEPLKHKHNFKFVEPSQDNILLWFACTTCSELGFASREALSNTLLK